MDANLNLHCISSEICNKQDVFREVKWNLITFFVFAGKKFPLIFHLQNRNEWIHEFYECLQHFSGLIPAQRKKILFTFNHRRRAEKWTKITVRPEKCHFVAFERRWLLNSGNCSRQPVPIKTSFRKYIPPWLLEMLMRLFL